MNHEQLLEQFGFSPHEAKIYLAALELGESTISELAHKSEVPRTTVQEVVEHMHRKGLLLTYMKKSHKYWIAENPEKILQTMKTKQEIFADAIPSLLAINKSKQNKPSVTVYSGVTEIKLIMDEVIETKHHISALISWDDWVDFVGDDYIKNFIERRYKHFLKIRMISPRTKLSQTLKKDDQAQLRTTKFLPESVNLKRISNFIFGDKIAIISLNKKEPTGILVQDEDIAYANTLYFENLWEHSSEF